MKNKKTILLVTGITLALIVILSLALLKLSHDKASKYDITFICDTNYLVDNITVSKNDTITKPEDPVKENHRFVGWYYNGELYDFNSKVTSDIKLEARWEKIQKVSGVKLNHSVMILYIGETSKLTATVLPKNADNKNVTWKSTSPDIVSVDSKGNIKALKEGNATIVVTTEDGNYTAKVNILSRMSIVGDSSQADITNTSFKVQFKDDNGKTLYSTQTIKYGNKVVEPEAPTKEGHNFLGWYNGKTKYSFDSKVKSNLTLTAKWEKNKYTITFVNYDGTVLETKAVEYGSTPNYTKELPVKPSTDETGKYIFKFNGWSPSVSAVTEDITYTATFIEAISTFNVTFVDDDGSVLSTTQTIEYDKTATKPEAPTKEGHTFLGWYNGENEFSFEAPVKSNLTLTAKWEKNKYTITFVNYDGTVLETKTLEYGSTPTYTADEPTKTKDETYTYSFAGWDNDLTTVTKDTTYTAVFNENYIDYLITFVDEDKTTLSQKNYHYGDTVILPQAPTKDANEQFTYTFAGWSPNVTTVQGNATYTATYTETLNTYDVTFVDGDGSVLSTTQTIEYGKTATKPEAPTKEGHNFLGWYNGENEFSFEAPVKSNLTLSAKWEKNKYTITFVNYDGTVLETKTLEYGSTPTYTADEPTKTKDETYTYSFAGWDNDLTTVTKDTTYTAVFNENYIDYLITFVDEDKTTLSQKNYHYGDTVILPDTPTKDANEQFTYTFAGWSPNVTTVQGNATYTATYTETLNTYDVTFVDDDGSVLSTTQTIEYGKTATKPEAPTKEGHKFLGWYNGENEFSFDVQVKSNLTLTAKWEKNKYTITFVNYDGTVLETKTLEYGDIPTYTKELPVKPGDDQNSYEFTGWYPTITTVKGNTTYTATYNGNINIYQVVFVDIDGTTLSPTQNVAYGNKAIEPNEPTKEGHKFLGWYNTYSKFSFDSQVKSNLTLTAKWEKNKYTITFVNYDGTVLETKTLEYGSTPTYTGDEPTKTKDKTYTYSFAGWDKDLTTVTKDTTYTAVFNENYIDYLITFVDEDKTTLSQKNYHYGDTVILPQAPTKDANEQFTYTFTGWSPNVTTVKGNATYTATYTETLNTYDVTFVDDDGSVLSTTQTIEYGKTATKPEAPTKEGHKFLGWYNGENEFSFDVQVKSNLTLSAKWEKNKYTITFVNYDGTVLETKTLEYGSTPSYTGDEPTKTKDEAYTYSFASWDKDLTTVTKDTTYTATYTETLNTYSVTFVDTDGSTLATSQNVEYGKTATKPEAPTKEGHKFLGWYNGENEFSFDVQVKSNLTLTAKWEKNKYTITFVNYDGTVLETKTLEYGSTPSYTGDEPTKAKDNQYTYTFDTWSPAITSVTKNVTYTATFKAELNVLEVKFVDTDGSIITTQSVTYGSKVSQPTQPTKEGYTFAGWFIGKAAYSFNKAVTTDLTLTASWNIKKYPVYFHANNGTILQTQIVSHGDTPKYTGATPTKPDDNKGSYVFTGWYPIIGPITEKTSFTAQFDLVFDIETELTGVLNSIKIKQFKTTHNNNNVNVEFVSYGNTTPPYYFLDIFFEVADLFHALSSNKKYESVELYYAKPGDKNGLTIDLTDYDLTDTRFSSWYDNGPNDPVSNWLGYLAKGEPATSAAADAASDDLIGKTVKITYKLKNGYSFENGKDTMEFTLTFSNEK